MKRTVLNNGVVLDGELMGHKEGTRLRRRDVAVLLLDKKDSVRCWCPNCEQRPMGQYWTVIWSKTGRLMSIGCVRFSARDMATVRKWAKGKVA